MPDSSDQTYLLQQQYHNSARLRARANLHARFRTNPHNWFAWLFDHLILPEQSRILELGCGPAWLWTRNIDRVPAGWDITLSDFSQGMVDEAQRRLQDSIRSFSFAVIDAQAIPYPDATFDAVIANHMLYHVPDLPTALAEIRRVLKPGGHFYASTIGTNHLHELSTLFPPRDASIMPGSGVGVGYNFSFNLENGAEQLAAYFPSVILSRREDALEVTEAEPIVDYVLSMSSARHAAQVDGLRAKMIAHVQNSLTASGSIHLTNEAGLFEAS
jgi:ubiquinone/menaquinone biosynthesis C-methylase UbiE